VALRAQLRLQPGTELDATVEAELHLTAQAKVRLLTADRRAVPISALVGAEFELLQ